MPMSGVMREILLPDEASMRGEDDFFSVARTMPFVAGRGVKGWTWKGYGGEVAHL